MDEMTELVKMLQEQHQRQMEAQEKRMTELIATLATSGHHAAATPLPTATTPAFVPFDATSELWKDYYARFKTFAGANSVSDDRLAQVFLTNQTTATYNLLRTLASQQTPPTDINDLAMDDIITLMDGQYDPKRFIVRERFRFWSGMERKPGETIQELAARIRQDAVRCDFSCICDPLDEAMRTRFVCSVRNEAVLKALFKYPDDELTFAKAVQIASETEDAARVAKETVNGSNKEPVLKMERNKDTARFKGQKQSNAPTPKLRRNRCWRCGKDNHSADGCRFKNAQCNFCKKKGHIEAACLTKKKQQSVGMISTKPMMVVNTVGSQDREPLVQSVCFKDSTFDFYVDTGTGDNFCERKIWTKLGRPRLQEPAFQYVGANNQPLSVMGRFTYPVSTDSGQQTKTVEFVVSKTKLNLLGRTALRQLNVDVNALLGSVKSEAFTNNAMVRSIATEQQEAHVLQSACQQLCTEFPDVFKPELGCLEGYELDVKFKTDAKPVFCKPRTVPLALQDDLNQAYDAGVKRGIWIPTQFNDYGTPVVPIRKALLPGQTKAKLRVCGDYSVTVNPQLETHRHPIPLPEDLMRKLGGGYFFSKVDLADAYNQIKLSPESQKKLALSTHRGVLLQTRLPFGISSAPGYFQEIMDQLTCDLRGVAVYLDDILVSGTDATEHLQNLRTLLQRLQEKGLRCKLEKCCFAEPSVEYLGHTLSRQGVSKGPKVDAVLKMPPPTDVASLRSFLGAVQFYGKFIPNLSTMTEPLTRLTRKGTAWTWSAEEQAAFQRLKNVLCEDTVLAHYDPNLEIGISCDASNVGIGTVLFHRYPDGSERPIANVSKTLTPTQRRYSQIQKEALAVIFGLKKFHHFLYARHFILVTDHKPLVAMFGPTRGIPAMAANRLARWALTLSQYDYTVEYRATKDHGNADVLSRLPSSSDDDFDGEEERADVSVVCCVKQLSRQLDPLKPNLLAMESKKDPVISKVMRYVREGWPNVLDVESRRYKKLEDSLTTESGCLFHGVRLVIPSKLRQSVLDLVHLGHFGMQRMKQLARSIIYWPLIDDDIERVSRSCNSCAEHQNKPPKPAIHPWMLPEKPWSRLHVDHTINFLGSNWLVLVDAYSKYPCVHATSKTSSKATMDILEQEFAHFGYPHTLVTDNATTFLSEEFQAWCQERGIVHLSGAPYHPATNGAAERLVQSFKKSMVKSDLPPKAALQEFLMQYRRTPLDSGLSPSEMLNGRQIRTKLDALIPSPAHAAQGRQAKAVAKEQLSERTKMVNAMTY